MYQYPTIKTLDQVESAISGAEEFIIAERDFGFVVNYLVNYGEETFPTVNYDENGTFLTAKDYQNAIRRECRGLMFDKLGRNSFAPSA